MLIQVFVIGGSQQFSQHHSTTINSGEQQITNDTETTGRSVLDLPDEVYLHLFSFLSPIDLCQISNVCKKWYRLATDDNVWRQRLIRDTKSWSSINSRSNPLSYALVQSDRSQKEIYLTCSPTIRRRSNQLDDGFVYLSQFSNYVRSWFGSSKDLIMLGPGLESYSSPLVKNLMWDESKRFQAVGMIPGNGGFGSGIKMKVRSHLFNLITLYTNCMKERESRTSADRLATTNHLVQSNNVDHYEISPKVRDVCRESNGLIYVIDASQENKLSDFCTELQVMTREFSYLPLLILSCVRNADTKRWSTIDVVRDLQLSSLGNSWMVQDCYANDTAGVEEGFVWLLTPTRDNNLFFGHRVLMYMSSKDYPSCFVNKSIEV
jgi:F-box protein 4